MFTEASSALSQGSCGLCLHVHACCWAQGVLIMGGSRAGARVHVQNTVPTVQMYGFNRGCVGGHGTTQRGLRVWRGLVPKYSRSTLSIIGVCWFVFRGRVMGID